MIGTSETPSLGNNTGRPGEVLVASMNNPLDFATYCDRGKIDAETDGDTWHADPGAHPLGQHSGQRPGDGWLERTALQHPSHPGGTGRKLRTTIVDNIDRLGGLNTRGLVSRALWLDVQEGTRQLILFETGTDYSLD